MSEVILKAVAKALVEQDKGFDHKIAELKQQFSSHVDQVTLDKVCVELYNGIANLKTNLEGQLKLVPAPQIDEDKVKSLLAEQSTVQMQTNLEKFATTEHVSSVTTELMAYQDELNNGTIALLSIARESLEAKIATNAKTSNQYLFSIEANLVEFNDSLTETNTETKAIRSELDTLKTVSGFIGADGIGFDTKTYSEGIYREGVVVQHNLGQVFRAVRDTTSEPGVDDTWERLGSAGLRHRGVFDEGLTYEQGDIYIKDFGSFLVVDKHRTVLLAGRGPQGKKGDRGEASKEVGPKGSDGTSIKEVIAGETGFVLEMTDGALHTVLYPENIFTLDKLKTIAAECDTFNAFKLTLLELK